MFLIVLIRSGAEVGIRDIEGYTALHRAIMSDHRQVVLKMFERQECLQVRSTPYFLMSVLYRTTVHVCRLFQGLLKAQQVCATSEMAQLVRLAAVRRQREVVNPILFECAMNGDAQRLFCTLEEGDCVNPMVSARHFFATTLMLCNRKRTHSCF